MKKIIIISAILLLAVTVFAQQSTRERSRKVQEQKKEATARRTVQNHKSEATARRTVQSQNRAITAKRPVQTQRNENSVKRKNQTSRNENYAKGRVHSARKNQVRTAPAARKKTVHTGNSYAGKDRIRPSKAKTHTGNQTRNGNNKSNAEVRSTGRKHYATPNRKHVRKNHGASTHHVPVRYKTTNYHYRVPGHVNVTWTHNMYREYRSLYPDYHYWYYPTGYRIVTLPAYRAYFHIGEVRNVYGRIHNVWYSWNTDEYHLYFGGTYPYQDFTVIVPGKQARRFHRHPEAFFSGRYIWVTGLVSTFEGKPEIMVMRKHQINLY